VRDGNVDSIMKLVKLAIGNVSSTVGATDSNIASVISSAKSAAAEGVWLIAFPEQVTGGYPAEDLVQWKAFIDAQRAALQQLADETRSLPTIIVAGAIVRVGGQLFNVAAVVHGGAILGLVPKEKLPTYNVFYEARTLARGTPHLALDADGVPLGDYVFDFDDRTIAVEVCEDGWSPDGPMRRRCYSGAELVVNVSASPYRVGVVPTRREMLATRSADNQALLLYANAVGGQDGLVFDGGGYVFQNGRLLLDAPRFRQGYATCVVDLDRTRRLRTENTTWRSDCETFQADNPPVPSLRSTSTTADSSGLRYPAPETDSFFLPPTGMPSRSPRDEALDDLYEALSLGLKDYYEKSGAFRRFGVALSGGRDSLLALLITWRAAQLRAEAGAAPAAESISVFYMPSRFSMSETFAVTSTICQELGLPLTTLSIDEAFERELAAVRTMLAGEPSALTVQNIQARLRAQRMWNWANSSSGLFVQTSDMSEKAVGYTTIGGDLEGALSVIANVPKTVVIAMLERLHARFAWRAVAMCLETTPGPELAERQVAENELMPFRILDACLYLYAGEKLSPADVSSILPTLFPEVSAEQLHGDARRFAKLFTQSIYKWVQSPLALHAGSLDLDRERALQLPVVQRTEWWD
jgi:NAD+ synthase (glutamine-hydrolysing)